MNYLSKQDHFGRPQGMTSVALMALTLTAMIIGSLWPPRAGSLWPPLDTMPITKPSLWPSHRHRSTISHEFTRSGAPHACPA